MLDLSACEARLEFPEMIRETGCVNGIVKDGLVTQEAANR